MSKKIYHSYTKPGVGKYWCVACHYFIELKSDDEELPVCPFCGVEEFTKEEK